MSFNYSADLSTNRDWVRFLIGDTVESKARLQDAEIDALLVEESENKYLAAARALELVLSQWILKGEGISSKSVDGLSISYSQAGGGETALRARIKELRERGARLSTQRPTVFRVLT